MFPNAGQSIQELTIDAVLIEHLKESGLREAESVLNLIQSGVAIEFEPDIKADPVALKETYTTRCAHLSQFNTHHAIRLRKATEEFVENLSRRETESPISHARVDDTLLGSYIIWYVVDGVEPIGCQYVIGKSEVPEETWEQIWNDV